MPYFLYRRARIAQALCLVVAGGVLAAACAPAPEAPASPTAAEPVAEPRVDVREVSVAATVAFTEGPTVAEDGTVYLPTSTATASCVCPPTVRCPPFGSPAMRPTG